MEDKEINEIIPKNDEAPPVLFESFHNNMNNNNNVNNVNNINNNINIKESNFNLFPNFMNNQVQINPNNKIHMNNNKNINSQMPYINMNPFLLRNQFYSPYNIMHLNYIN